MTTALTPADLRGLLDLVHRYAAAVDARDWDAVVGLFAEDGRMTVPDPPRSMSPTVLAVGRPAIRGLLTPLEGFDSTRHDLTGSTWSAVDADTASGRTTCVAHHVERARTTSWVWHLEYADRAVRTPYGWLLAERDLHLQRVERATL